MVYLLSFIILLLPFFILTKATLFKRVQHTIANFLAYPLASLVLILPLLYVYNSLYIRYTEQGSLVDDWFVFMFSINFLLYGYFLAGSDRFWNNCEQFRKY